ncbi:MAG: hypothetical protein HQL58_07780 [Magnetococcales bacterium]|nr:hypothetical protein [Magnetococcales bacterium]
MNAPVITLAHHDHEAEKRQKRQEMMLCSANGINIVLILLILDLIYRASPPPQTTFSKFMIPPPRTVWDMDMIDQAAIAMGIMVVLTLARLAAGYLLHGWQWKRGDLFALTQVLIAVTGVILLLVLF